MAKTVTEARRPDATAGADTINRNLFRSKIQVTHVQP
jgi:hypothetical protein